MAATSTRPTTAWRRKNWTPPVKRFVVHAKALLNSRNGSHGRRCPGFSSRAHKAGVSVSATMPEITTETAMVTANCR
jgi:hypothetical protein